MQGYKTGTDSAVTAIDQRNDARLTRTAIVIPRRVEHSVAVQKPVIKAVPGPDGKVLPRTIHIRANTTLFNEFFLS